MLHHPSLFQHPLGRGLLNGLVSFWSFETGTALGNDSLGANTLTTSGATSVAGLIGNGAHFTRGSTQFLSIASGSVAGLAPTGLNSFTVMAAVKFDSLTGQQNLAAAFQSAAGQSIYKLLKFPAGNFLFQTTADGTTFSTVNSGILPVTGAWYLAFGWFDAVAGNNFIQVLPGGEAVSHAAASLSSATPAFYLGGDNFSGQKLDGTLDMVGFWSRVLTRAERLFLYNQALGRQYPFTS